MGLDQYIYRISKAELEDRVYKVDEFNHTNLSRLSVSDFERDRGLCNQLRPYAVKRNVECKLYDVDKMIEDYSLPKDSYIWRYGGGGITIGGKTEDGESINQDITNEEIELKYTKTEIIPYYIWAQEEVQYWRKNYKLQDWAYDNLDGIDNTAYCVLNSELIEEINYKFDEDIPAEDATEDSALFYWEWY